MTAHRIYATRTSVREARAYFDAGGHVLVSDRGHLAVIPVGPLTVTHDRTRGTFEALHAVVKAYGDSRQRYYLVPDPDSADAALDRLAELHTATTAPRRAAAGGNP